MAGLQTNSLVLSVAILAFLLGIWELSIPEQQSAQALTEYELLMGGAVPKAGVPPPSEVFMKAVAELSDPFYDAGQKFLQKKMGVRLVIFADPGDSTTTSTRCKRSNSWLMVILATAAAPTTPFV